MKRLLLAGMALVVLSPGGVRAQDTSPSRKPSGPVFLELRDAPVYKALELLFRAEKAQYALKPALRSIRVTLKGTYPSGIEEALGDLTRSVKPALIWTTENGIYIVQPSRDIAMNAGDRLRQPFSGGDAPDLLSVPPLVRVGRRVSGIIRKGAFSAAIIETGAPRPDALVNIVQTGYPVDSGCPGIPYLKVESITATQVILRARDKQAIVVHLSGLASPPALWQTWGTTKE